MNSNKIRGLRNNNPLNIRRSSDHWQGLSTNQTDRQFFQFQTLAYGFRAAFLTIRTYMFKYGLYTPRQIISRWAPECDNNNTAGYISVVCATSHLLPDQTLHWNDPNEMIPLVQAMAYVECGVIIDGVSIRKGYEMAETLPPPSSLTPRPPQKGGGCHPVGGGSYCSYFERAKDSPPALPKGRELL